MVSFRKDCLSCVSCNLIAHCLSDYWIDDYEAAGLGGTAAAADVVHLDLSKAAFDSVATHNSRQLIRHKLLHSMPPGSKADYDTEFQILQPKCSNSET